MDLFDILWLVICIGLPVISGIAASAEKKKKAQGRPVVNEVVPAAGKTLETKPAVAVPAKNHCSDAIADGAIGGAEPKKRIDKERIDPEKLVVYTAIMNPKFNVC